MDNNIILFLYTLYNNFLYILIVNVIFYILITMTGEVNNLVIICFNCSHFIWNFYLCVISWF